MKQNRQFCSILSNGVDPKSQTLHDAAIEGGNVKKVVCLLAGLVIATFGLTAPANASNATSAPAIAPAVAKYKGCKVMRKAYPAGVARTQAAANDAVARGYWPPEVNKAVYAKNKKLDPDKDGVACPAEASDDAFTGGGDDGGGSGGDSGFSPAEEEYIDFLFDWWYTENYPSERRDFCISLSYGGSDFYYNVGTEVAPDFGVDPGRGIAITQAFFRVVCEDEWGIFL